MPPAIAPKKEKAPNSFQNLKTAKINPKRITLNKNSKTFPPKTTPKTKIRERSKISTSEKYSFFALRQKRKTPKISEKKRTNGRVTTFTEPIWKSVGNINFIYKYSNLNKFAT